MKVVIIGNHAAGISACDTLRNGDKKIDITLISKEDNPPYSRCLLPFLLSGEKTFDDILFRDKDYYRQNDITTMFGREVLKVLCREKKILLDTGEKLDYDKLIIATGGTPQSMTIPGVKNKGVHTLRTIDDTRSILSGLGRVNKAIILGGGLVGLKAAIGLHKGGKRVTVVVSSPTILSQIVNESEAEIVAKYLTDHGIEIVTNTSPARILGEELVEGVEMTNGDTYGCELVIIGKGVSANRSLVEGTEIESKYGIITDEFCRTNVADIYAAGDVAQSHDTVRKSGWMNTLWPHAVEEGRVAASDILRNSASLRGRTSMNSLMLFDLPVISCGLSGAREEIPGSEEIVFKKSGKPSSMRFVIKDDKLVAYVLLGDVKHAGVLTSLINREVPVDRAKDLFRTGRIDFNSLFPVLCEHRDKFTEKEFLEIFSFIRTGDVKTSQSQKGVI
jgi:nitrite reductase (NADH) large subunit